MQQTSRGKFDRLQRTTAGFTDTRLDGYGLCCSLPTRPRVLASYPVLVHRHTPLLHASFRPRLATTPLRFANPSPPPGWIRDLHPQTVEHARHTMTDHGKAYGENPPTAFPKALEIERTDFHISSVPTTAANLTQFKTRKEPFPVRLTFAPFRLILRLEKTAGAGRTGGSALRRKALRGLQTRDEVGASPRSRWPTRVL